MAVGARPEAREPASGNGETQRILFSDGLPMIEGEILCSARMGAMLGRPVNAAEVGFFLFIFFWFIFSGF
jgi:hypothetical protein